MVCVYAGNSIADRGHCLATMVVRKMAAPPQTFPPFDAKLLMVMRILLDPRYISGLVSNVGFFLCLSDVIV